MKPKPYHEQRPWPEAHEVFGLVAAWKLRVWRLTDHNFGQIPGVKGNLTIVATDGNLGVFLDAEGAPYLGHIERREGDRVLQQGFDGKVEALGTSARREAKKKLKSLEPKPESKKTKRQRAKERAWAALDEE